MRTVLCICLSVVLFMPGVALSVEPSVLATLQKTNTPMTLMAVQFKDAKAGWAVGSGGALFSTVDGGKKWKKQASGTSALLTGIYFIDQKTGWVTGAAGTLRRSVNGGESWTGHP
ncbi:MAG: YCF48-related protein, partial [Nitrospirota bacterium]